MHHSWVAGAPGSKLGGVLEAQISGPPADAPLAFMLLTDCTPELGGNGPPDRRKPPGAG
jgi:hypothetical protein